MTERRVVAAVALAIALPVVADALAVIVAAAFHLATPDALPAAAIGGGAVLLAIAVGLSWSGLARRLPAALDGSARRHPVRAALWVLLALVAVAQIARVATFMTDPAQRWGAVIPAEKPAAHACMSAYVHAADLSRRGEPNVYAEEHYPAFEEGDTNARTPRETPVVGLAPWLDDPYQYPPPFLLLPRAALALTDQYLVIRTVWFAINTLFFLGGALVFCRWIGGREGLVAALLLPAVLAWPPTLADLQFGQFHLASGMLAALAMLAFQTRRARDEAIGGVALAFATIAKIAPGVLLIVLAVQRRWRALAFTAAAGAAFVALSLAVLGRAPFDAFVHYQLPRMSSGAAFSFSKSPMQLANDVSIAGLVRKLDFLGLAVEGAKQPIVWLCTLGLVALAAFAGLRTRDTDARLTQVATWIGLLALAALRSPLAPGVYVAATTTWLLSFAAARPGARAAAIALLWIVSSAFLPLPKPALMVAVSIVPQLAQIAIGVGQSMPSSRNRFRNVG